HRIRYRRYALQKQCLAAAIGTDQGNAARTGFAFGIGHARLLGPNAKEPISLSLARALKGSNVRAFAPFQRGNARAVIRQRSSDLIFPKRVLFVAARVYQASNLLLIYGERDEVIDRTSAMRVARHHQAERLVVHRLAFALISYNHLLAGEPRI